MEECFSQLSETQQMPGSRRRGPDCHYKSERMRGCVLRACVLYARLPEPVQSLPFSIDAV